MKYSPHTIDSNRLSYERKLIGVTCIIVALINILSTIFNIILGLSFEIILTTTLAIVVFIVLYVLNITRKNHLLVKWSITIFAILFIGLAWFYNSGADGPTFFLLSVFIAYIIFLWHDYRMHLFLGIVAVMILTFFLIENNYPDLLKKYPNQKSQTIDNYLGLIISSLMISFFAFTAKNSYLNQYFKAKKSDELKSLFLKNMSHEIRTPLNAIVGFSELVADKEVSEQEKNQYSEIIAHNSKSLTSIVNNILDISNIESNQLMINYTTFNVVNMLVRLRDSFAPVLSLSGNEKMEIKIITQRFDVLLNSDEFRVEQILSNLIENAIKFTIKGSIEVSFAIEQEKIIFYVKDTGIGINPNNFELIFQRFTKVEQDSKKLYQGTGIGLYLCKEIVHLLHGEIYVESALGKGSTFSFYLPYHEQL